MMTSYLSGNATADDLDSYGIPANEDAMRELDGDLIEITHETDDRIFAKVTPQGRALLEQLQAEREDDPPGSTARAVKPSSANMIALHEDGAHILVTAEGCALLDRFHIEQQGGKAANWRHRPAR